MSLVDDEIWYEAEEWGRWGHREGNSLLFKIQCKDCNEYMLVLKLIFPGSFLYVDLECRSIGYINQRVIMNNTNSILWINLYNYIRDGVIHISLNTKNLKDKKVENESRELGIGFY